MKCLFACDLISDFLAEVNNVLGIDNVGSIQQETCRPVLPRAGFQASGKWRGRNFGGFFDWNDENKQSGNVKVNPFPPPHAHHLSSTTNAEQSRNLKQCYSFLKPYAVPSLLKLYSQLWSLFPFHRMPGQRIYGLCGFAIICCDLLQLQSYMVANTCPFSHESDMNDGCWMDCTWCTCTIHHAYGRMHHNARRSTHHA